ncbi:hypothetical protein [Okeania sp. SIO2B3]|uniref:hypothetical protein n=1 Tax=Okeania sp. SIO2B3 TaxID=2607784 RepID=UPI0013C2957D|nr:hypothetical protein [Okeania sp. SIO2B3]NET45754.1 hypothetical protein [Okeania sp. SIO2B3]
MIYIILAFFLGCKKIFDLVVSQKVQLNKTGDKILKIIPSRQHHGAIYKQFALTFFPISILIGGILTNSYYIEISSKKKVLKIEEKRVL